MKHNGILLWGNFADATIESRNSAPTQNDVHFSMSSAYERIRNKANRRFTSLGKILASVTRRLLTGVILLREIYFKRRILPNNNSPS